LEFNVPFQHKYGYIRDDEMPRTEKGRMKGTKSAQCNKPLDGSKGEAPSSY